MTKHLLSLLLLIGITAEAAIKIPFSTHPMQIPFITSREFNDRYEITNVKYISLEKPHITHPSDPRYRIRITFMPTHEKYIMSEYDNKLTENYFSVYFIAMDNKVYALGRWEMIPKDLTRAGYTMDLLIFKHQLLGVKQIKGLLFLQNSNTDHYSLAPLDGKPATEDSYNITQEDITALITKPGTLKLGVNLRSFTIPCIMDSLFLSRWHLVDFKIVENDRQKPQWTTTLKYPPAGALNSMMCKMNIAPKVDFSEWSTSDFVENGFIFHLFLVDDTDGHLIGTLTMDQNYPNCVEHTRASNNNIKNLNIYPPFVEGDKICSVRGMVIAQDYDEGLRLVEMIKNGMLDFYPEWYDPRDLHKPYKGLQDPTEFAKHGGYFITTYKSRIRWTESAPPSESGNNEDQSSNVLEPSGENDMVSSDTTGNISAISVNVACDTITEMSSPGDIIRQYLRKPTYCGGKDSLQSYLNRHLIPLIDDLHPRPEGSMRIILDINKKGCILSARLENEFDKFADSMIISSLDSMPRWNPGGIVTVDKTTLERNFEPRQMTTYIDLTFNVIESERKTEEATPVPVVFPLEPNDHKIATLSNMDSDWRLKDVSISPSIENTSALTINECMIMITLHLSDKFMDEHNYDSAYPHIRNMFIGCHDGNQTYILGSMNIDKELHLQLIEQAKRSDDGHTAVFCIGGPYEFGKDLKRINKVVVTDNQKTFIDLTIQLNSGEINFIQ